MVSVNNHGNSRYESQQGRWTLIKYTLLYNSDGSRFGGFRRKFKIRIGVPCPTFRYGQSEKKTKQKPQANERKCTRKCYRGKFSIIFAIKKIYDYRLFLPAHKKLLGNHTFDAVIS